MNTSGLSVPPSTATAALASAMLTALHARKKGSRHEPAASRSRGTSETASANTAQRPNTDSSGRRLGSFHVANA